jgi:NAD-dependent DNA ligase
VADLYSLTPRETFAELERMGEKSARTSYDSIQRSKTRTLDRLLCGLGIPQVGRSPPSSSPRRPHARAHGGVDEAEKRERVDAIRGFGPKMVESVVLFFAMTTHRELMEKLKCPRRRRPQPRAEVASGRAAPGQERLRDRRPVEEARVTFTPTFARQAARCTTREEDDDDPRGRRQDRQEQARSGEEIRHQRWWTRQGSTACSALR